MRRVRIGLAIGLLSLASLGATIDKDALRALLRIPFLPDPINLDLPAIRAERAGERLTKLSPELASDRKNPRLNFRAGAYMREMGDPTSREFVRKAIDGLLEAEKTKPLDADQTKLLIEALTAGAEFDQASDRIAKAGLPEAEMLMYRGELAIFRVLEAADVALRSPGGDRMLSISLEALRNPNEAPAWRELLAGAAKDLKRAAQLNPKDGRSHRSLAVALVASAYVQSSILWRQEGKTTNLMPEEAFAHFKEAANLAPEDVVAQWEAYESRLALERFRGATSATSLPKEAQKYGASIASRLEAVAKSDQSDARIAAEILGVILAQGAKPADALPWLERAHGDGPRPRVDLLRFRLLLALGKLDDALPLGQSVLQAVPLPEIALEVAAAADALGKPELAHDVVVDGLSRYPGAPELRLARTVLQLRNPEATELSDAAKQLDVLATLGDEEPLMPEIRFTRAVFYGLIGDLDMANRLLDGLANKMPERVAKARKALLAG